MKTKISVIIPIYNAEKYLKECLDSVIGQSLNEFEIICINDGSMDKSLNILEDYASKDKRIKIFNQENQGVSTARNNGIKEAQGEYIFFLDSDDYLENNALETAYNHIKKKDCDILIFGANLIRNNEKKSALNIDLIEKIKKNQFSYIDFVNLNTVIWDKLFRTEFLKKHQIEFPTELVVSEDGVFCLQSYFLGAKYDYIDKILYNHNDCVANSITANCEYGIKEDFRSFQYLFKLEGFKTADLKIKLAIINKFCGGALFYWEKLDNESYRKTYYQDILTFKRFIEAHFSKKDLLQLKGYKKVCKTLKKYSGKFPYNIFCKMKFQTHVIFKILGIEFIRKIQ